MTAHSAMKHPGHPVSAPADTALADDALADTRSVFAELVCADPELLQAEFEALIAANYPPGDARTCRQSPRRSGPPRTDRTRPVPPAVCSPRLGPRPGSGGETGTGGVARERGPPRQHARAEAAHTSRTKTSDMEVINRPLSRLSERDGSTLVTMMMIVPGA